MLSTTTNDRRGESGRTALAKVLPGQVAVPVAPGRLRQAGGHYVVSRDTPADIAAALRTALAERDRVPSAAGTVLGRVGSGGKLAPHVNFSIRPAGRGAPKIDGVKYLVVPSEETAVSMYEAGELPAAFDSARGALEAADLGVKAAHAPIERQRHAARPRHGPRPERMDAAVADARGDHFALHHGSARVRVGALLISGPSPRSGARHVCRSAGADPGDGLHDRALRLALRLRRGRHRPGVAGPGRRAGIGAGAWPGVQVAATLYFIKAVCHSLARIVGHSSQSRPRGSTNMQQLVSG